jgi:hypothetical protein
MALKNQLSLLLLPWISALTSSTSSHSLSRAYFTLLAPEEDARIFDGKLFSASHLYCRALLPSRTASSVSQTFDMTDFFLFIQTIHMSCEASPLLMSYLS